MISAGDFRNGVTLEIDGQVVQIMEFQHVNPPRNSRLRESTEWTCSICMLTASCLTS